VRFYDGGLSINQGDCIDLSPAGITIKNRPKNNSQFCMRRSSADGVRKRTNKDMITNRNVLRKY
jgi:hypothetical protein